MHNRSTTSAIALLWIFLLLGGIFFGNEWEWLAVIPAVLLHEGGHCLAAFLCGTKIRGMTLDVLGARIKIEGVLSYGQEFFIATGGPFVNFLCAVLLRIFIGDPSQAMNLHTAYFFYASIGLGLLNLLPVGTLDGGRMLHTALSYFLSPEKADQCLRKTAFFFLLLLWILAAYALLQGVPLMSGMIFLLSLLFRHTLTKEGI